MNKQNINDNEFSMSLTSRCVKFLLFDQQYISIISFTFRNFRLFVNRMRRWRVNPECHWEAQSLDTGRCTTPALFCGHRRSPPLLERSYRETGTAKGEGGGEGGDLSRATVLGRLSTGKIFVTGCLSMTSEKYLMLWMGKNQLIPIFWLLGNNVIRRTDTVAFANNCHSAWIINQIALCFTYL